MNETTINSIENSIIIFKYRKIKKYYNLTRDMNNENKYCSLSNYFI